MLEAQSKTLNQNKSVSLSTKTYIIRENIFLQKTDKNTSVYKKCLYLCTIRIRHASQRTAYQGGTFFLYAQCNGIYQELGTGTSVGYKFIVYSLELIVYSSF